MSKKKGILERLAEGPVIGDGSMCFTLEKRGYCKAGPWTPEAVIEYPDAVLQLHREYVRAGADVVQTATFYSSDDKLSYGKEGHKVVHTTAEINDAACKLARKAADEGGCLVCGSLSPVPSFGQGKGESVVRAEFLKQVHVFEEHDVDFVIAEFFDSVEEIEICASAMKKLNKPMALCMRAGLMGDCRGVSLEECAVRMAKTGAEIIGSNCMYDINTQLKIMKRMKDALDKADLHPYLICQPLGYLCPDVEDNPVGYISLPEWPFALESRALTRIDAHKFARAAWELGIRYIGGCCGFEPQQVRALAQELAPEREKDPPCADLCPVFGEGLKVNAFLSTRKRTSRDYWYNVKPGSGRPFCPSLTEPTSASFEYHT